MKAFIYDFKLEAKMRMVDNYRSPSRPGRGMVMVQVVAVGLNPSEWKVPNHKFLRIGRDMTMAGIDFSGKIIAVGPGVKHLSVGDSVFGFHWECFGERIVVKATEVAKVPSNCNVQDAAAWYCCAMTAYQALEQSRAIKAPIKLLVIGASGGIGHFAVQLAKLHPEGSHVIGVCSTRNIDMVKGLGADEVLDYTAPGFDLHHSVSDCDVIIDCIHPVIDYVPDAMKCLRTASCLKSSGKYKIFDAIQATTFLRSLCCPCLPGKVNLVMCKQNKKDARAIAELFASGTLRAHISDRLPFEEGALIQAIQEMKTTRIQGKVIALLEQ